MIIFNILVKANIFSILGILDSILGILGVLDSILGVYIIHI